MLAEKIGLTKKTIQRYENGEHKIDMERLHEIAEALEVDISALLNGVDSFLGVDISELKLSMLPVVNSVKTDQDNIFFDSIESHEPTPTEWDIKDCFYIRVKDDSMLGSRIGKDDLLLIKKTKHENGEVAVVSVNGKLLIRKLYINDDQIILQPDNSAYPPLFCKRSDVYIIGKPIKNIITFS